MMAKRTVFLGMLICATSVAAFGQPAVVAPQVGGDIGLFTMSTADNPRASQFTLGMYAWYQPQIAGPFFQNQPDETRFFNQYGGTISLGLGLTDWWSVFVAGGGQVTRSGGGWDAGYVNSLGIVGPFNAAEGQKIRVGTKFNYHSEVDPDFRIAGWLAARIPISTSDVGGGLGPDVEGVNSPRTDWEWGAAISKSWFTGMVSYQLSGSQDGPTFDSDEIRVANIVRFGVGATIPVGHPMFQIIIEALYNVYDGGDFPANDYAQLNGGARLWFGRSGWALSGALGTNMTMLLSEGTSQNPFGGVLGVTYAAWPPEPPPPVVVRPPSRSSRCLRRPLPRSDVAAASAAVHPDDHRRDRLRRHGRAPDEHRQGGARRACPPHEERPERHGRRDGLHGQHRFRADEPRARRPARPGREGLPGDSPRDRPGPHHDRLPGSRRPGLRQRDRRGQGEEPPGPVLW